MNSQLGPVARDRGGKGIRTPDIQLAKLALYQLSYAPWVSNGLSLKISIDCQSKN